MILYLSLLVGLVVSLMLLNGLLGFFGVTSLTAFEGVMFPFLTFLLIFLIDIVVSLFIRFVLPKSMFSPYVKRYVVSDKERKFFEKIKVRVWKDKVPELGQLANFKKDKIESNEPKYLFKFLEETCYAETIHKTMSVFPLLILFFFPAKLILLFPLPMCMFNLLINIPSFIIQRYNRPKLLKLYEWNLRKAGASGAAQVKRAAVVDEADDAYAKSHN